MLPSSTSLWFTVRTEWALAQPGAAVTLGCQTMFVFIAVRCLYDVFHVVTECNPGKSFKALSKSSFSALRC